MVLYHQSLTLCLPKRMHCNRLWRNCLILIKIVDSILKSFCFLSLFLTLSCVFVLLVVYCFVGVFCCLAYLFASCDPTFVDQGVSCKVVILSYRQTPVCILYLCSENRIFYTCVSAIVIPRFSSSHAFLLLCVDCGMSLIEVPGLVSRVHGAFGGCMHVLYKCMIRRPRGGGRTCVS